MSDFALHPTAAALAGHACITHRGARPLVVCADDNAFKSFGDVILNKVPFFGPTGQDGIYEEEIAAILGSAVRPGDGAADPAGDPPGLFIHTLAGNLGSPGRRRPRYLSACGY